MTGKNYFYSAYKKTILFIFLISLAYLSTPILQAGAVFVSPNRVFFDENQRATRIILLNKSEKTVTVSFGWDHLVMRDGGALKRLAEGESYPGYKPISEYVKYSPRRVVLRPQQSQKIRLIVQKPADLPPGEYRTHFRIMSQPVEGTEDVQQEGEDRLQLEFRMKVSKSIPLILWVGETNVDIKYDGHEIVNLDRGKAVRFKFQNNSTRTIYTEIIFECPDQNGELVRISRAAPRFYPEANYAFVNVNIERRKLDTCQTVTAKLKGIDDPEYKDRVIDQWTFSAR